ncbi:hypothetical protein DPMN_179930 [Dreissena polymorpha]|uniref:Uncharacterized protein n=1 Tax=Dreissena polymorpha TaxID=45954 RepID=A0A9D4EEX9_DREPO|nr:hypothetical protein DPMN_179930 [Dreissena polymorpha]
MELETDHMGLLFRDKDLRQMRYLHMCLSMKQKKMTLSSRFKIVQAMPAIERMSVELLHKKMEHRSTILLRKAKARTKLKRLLL